MGNREDIAEIFASSLTTGEVPEDWRLANVAPFFKGLLREPREPDIENVFTYFFKDGNEPQFMEMIVNLLDSS